MLRLHPKDPSKPWKFLLFPPTKIASVFTMLLKVFVLLGVLMSISLFSYTLFSNNSQFFPCFGCDKQSYMSLLTIKHNQIDQEPPTNISHILFGIGGSYKTWENRCHYTETWWKPNITRGFVWLDQSPPTNSTWLESWPPFQVSSNTSGFKYTCTYGSRSAIRMARIVKESFELGLDDVRWFVMGDDDTIFFKENLLTVLSKYDHNEMYYIGGVSESVEQDVIHSYTMGYGGGGFAISYPLAAELVRVLDGCINRYSMFYGSDQRIGGCMSQIGVPLTRELGFHQVDIRGSPYGLLAAHPVAPLVSLHHLDYVQPMFPGKSRIDSVKHLTEAYKSDPSRVVQQSICYDLAKNWSISLSWGYTIQLYPKLLTAKTLTTPIQTFLTWRTWSQKPFTFNTRIQRLDTCDRPLIYFFDTVEKLDDGGTLTSYKKVQGSKKYCDKGNYEPAQSIQQFDVYASILDAETWKKAPRRRCCEVISRNEDEVNGVVRLRLRECRRWESVTPPF